MEVGFPGGFTSFKVSWWEVFGGDVDHPRWRREAPVVEIICRRVFFG